ncbi:MAG: hypothetical protein WAP03_27890 [Methylorubrum rhodinum]|uniref:hypothetical protein n=1 Tax=Methylorubrum rhodinum TaxID=29428 RepID=UPI003BAE8C23
MMSREEIDRHVAGILALRGQQSKREKCSALWDFNPNRRRFVRTNAGSDHGAVDTTFVARQRAGWLPRGGRD